MRKKIMMLMPCLSQRVISSGMKTLGSVPITEAQLKPSPATCVGQSSLRQMRKTWNSSATTNRIAKTITSSITVRKFQQFYSHSALLCKKRRAREHTIAAPNIHRASWRRLILVMRKKLTTQVMSSEKLMRTPLMQKSKPNSSISITGAQQRKSTEKATIPRCTDIILSERQRKRSKKVKNCFSEVSHRATYSSFSPRSVSSEVQSLSSKIFSRPLRRAMNMSYLRISSTSWRLMRNCGVSLRNLKERSVTAVRGRKQQTQKMTLQRRMRKNQRMVANPPTQKQHWMMTPPTCRRRFQNCSDRKQKHRLKEFSRPNPIRNSPTSARTRLGVIATRKFPVRPRRRHQLKVVFLPKLSTSEPAQMQPKMDPRKNMPMAVDMISDLSQ